MTDHFALLNEPRRPWLDPDSLKQKFLALSAETHPDHFHGGNEAEKKYANERATALNAAYQCLRNPKDRLGHLLELELGRKPTGLDRAPDKLMNSFLDMAELFRKLNDFLSEREKVTSPLLRVQFFERAQSWTEQLTEVELSTSRARDELAHELQTMNDIWKSASAPGFTRGPDALPLRRLEEIYRLLGYYDRWTKQLQENRVRLAI